MDHQQQTHLLFVWTPRGYELYESEGEPPRPGTTVEKDGHSWRVAKVAPSPLPHDQRVCAYLQ